MFSLSWCYAYISIYSSPIIIFLRIPGVYISTSMIYIDYRRSYIYTIYHVICDCFLFFLSPRKSSGSYAVIAQKDSLWLRLQSENREQKQTVWSYNVTLGSTECFPQSSTGRALFIFINPYYLDEIEWNTCTTYIILGRRGLSNDTYI